MGQKVVYGEVILTINLVMDYLILWLTAKFAHVFVHRKRLLAGALTGALYALAMFWHGFGYFYTMPGKLLFSALILVISFAPIRLKKFLTIILYFYLISFSLVGITVGAGYFINNNTRAAYLYNGTLKILNNYFWYALLFAVLTGLAVGKLGPGIMRSKIIRNIFKASLTIGFGSQVVQVVALIDTGNNLREPISQMPVIIVEYKALADILPKELQEAFAGGENNLEAIINSLTDTEWGRRMRLIPFNSLGRANGILVAFRPDRVEINTGEEKIKSQKLFVGVHQRQLCPEGSYQALLHPDILSATFC